MQYGSQTYDLRSDRPILIEEIHRFEPTEGEALQAFLARIAAQLPTAQRLTLHRRAGRVMYAEVRLGYSLDTPDGGA